MPTKRSSDGKLELPFHKQLILGIAVALAGGTGAVVTDLLDDSTRCTQAIEITKDDALNSALSDRDRKMIASLAAKRAAACLTED